MSVEEQRIIIKFLSEEGEEPARIVERLQKVFRDQTLRESNIHSLIETFRQGEETVTDDSSSGKPLPSIKIGTLDGKFYCDQVLACFILRLLPEYKNSEIVR